ncbi:lactoylglutathione lyase [Streptococcus pneumoniae]|nr:lactoylglutathione lyase [Streptococcus pneumoniae]
MASKMLHTCLRVENLEKSIAFYQDAFGFKELRRRDFPDHAFTIVYLGLEALHQEHSAKGYEVTEPNGLPGTTPNYYFVKDPDGYKVEVIREK